MRKSYFIALEGIDKCGKSTVGTILTEKFNAHFMRFPDRSTRIGGLLDSYLQSKEKFCPQVVHLLFSANRWEMNDKIYSLLKEGTVICDRYYHSGIVYSMANNIEYEWAKQSDVGLIEPDVIAFIDIKPEQVSKREGFGKEIYEQLEVQNKVYGFYKNILKDVENVKYFDGLKTAEEVAQDIFDFVLAED